MSVPHVFSEAISATGSNTMETASRLVSGSLWPEGHDMSRLEILAEPLSMFSQGDHPVPISTIREVAQTHISKICLTTVLRYAQKLSTDGRLNYNDNEDTIRSRFQALQSLKNVFPYAGGYLAGAMCQDRGSGHTMHTCQAVSRMLELGQLQWRMAQLEGKTGTFYEFHKAQIDLTNPDLKQQIGIEHDSFVRCAKRTWPSHQTCNGPLACAGAPSYAKLTLSWYAPTITRWQYAPG